MSRPEEAATDLDALLAAPTPDPGDGVERADRDDRAGGREDRGSRPARSRLEAWLRGGSDAEDVDPSRSGSAGGQDGSRSGADADEGLTSAYPVGSGAGFDVGAEWSAAASLGDDAGAPTGSVEPAEGELGGVLRSIPVDAIEPNAYQPRRHFDEASLASLASSIGVVGVLQPILVRATGVGRYELVAGERRWRAAQRADLRMIPALVREVDDQGALEQAIVENLHRQDLNALEEAAAYQELTDDFGLTQDEVARRVGRSRSAVANTMRLLQLPPVVQRLVVQGLLSAGHARALLAVGDREAQVNLAERVVTEQLSVRQTEDAVRSWSSAEATSPNSGRDGGARTGGDRAGRSAGALEVQDLLEERLETRVDVQEAERGGRLVIRFADEQDLGRIARLLLGQEESQVRGD